MAAARVGKAVKIETPGWEGWFQAFESEADAWYYFNPDTGERQWAGETPLNDTIPTSASAPAGAKSSEIAAADLGTKESDTSSQRDPNKTEALPMGWHEDKTEEGQVYYWSDMGARQWDRPAATAAVAPPPFAIAAEAGA